MKRYSRLAIVPLVLTVLGLVGIGGDSGVMPLHQGLAQQQVDSSQEEQNKALVMTFFSDVYDNRNVSAIEKYLADNFSSVGGIDKELFTESLGATLNAFPDLTRSLAHIVAEGDMVTTFTSWNGTFSGEEFAGISANGNPFTAATADLFRISDGHIVEHWQIGDYSNFTQAIGI